MPLSPSLQYCHDMFGKSDFLALSQADKLALMKQAKEELKLVAALKQPTAV